MGVPSLFAYFFKKYNKCMRYVIEPTKENPFPNGHFDKSVLME